MRDRGLAKPLLACLVAGLFLTFAGLARTGLVLRSQVEPGYPEYLSNHVAARGFPLSWWVTGTPAGTTPSGNDRFLAGRFLASWACLLVPALLVWGGTAGLRRRARSRPL